MLCFAQDASGKFPRLYICPFDTEAAAQVGGQKEQKTDLVWAVLWGRDCLSPCLESNWRATPAQNNSYSNSRRAGCQQIATVIGVLEKARSSSAGTEIVDAPSLEVLKSRLDGSWSNLVPAHGRGGE